MAAHAPVPLATTPASIWVIAAAVLAETTRVPSGTGAAMPHTLRVDGRVEEVRRPGHSAVRDGGERVEHLHAGDRDAVTDRGRVLAGGVVVRRIEQQSRGLARPFDRRSSDPSPKARTPSATSWLFIFCAISIVPTFDDSRRMSAVVQCSMPFAHPDVRLRVVVRLHVRVDAARSTGPRTSCSGAMRPCSSAHESVMSLFVEPGSKRSVSGALWSPAPATLA